MLGLALSSSLSHAADNESVEQQLQQDEQISAANPPLHQHESVKPAADVMQPKAEQPPSQSVPEQHDSEEMPDEAIELPENKIVIVGRPQVSGLWGMTIPKAHCIEYYNFMENGDVVIKSDKEWTYGKYIYQVPALSEPGSPVLVMQIKYDNLQTDCSGNAIDQRGEQQQQYVKWTGASSMEFCAAQDGTQCFASLQRVLP